MPTERSSAGVSGSELRKDRRTRLGSTSPMIRRPPEYDCDQEQVEIALRAVIVG
jgi:hypothetical protein